MTGPNVMAALVRGFNDVASAVAHRLFRDGLPVAMHNETDAPRTHRRMMGFADAYFDGAAVLEGVTARRCDTAEELASGLRGREAVLVLIGDLDAHGWQPTHGPS